MLYEEVSYAHPNWILGHQKSLRERFEIGGMLRMTILVTLELMLRFCYFQQIKDLNSLFRLQGLI